MNERRSLGTLRCTECGATVELTPGRIVGQCECGSVSYTPVRSDRGDGDA